VYDTFLTAMPGIKLKFLFMNTKALASLINVCVSQEGKAVIVE